MTKAKASVEIHSARRCAVIRSSLDQPIYMSVMDVLRGWPGPRDVRAGEHSDDTLTAVHRILSRVADGVLHRAGFEVRL